MVQAAEARRSSTARCVACSRGCMPCQIHEEPPPERMRETYSERQKLNLNLNLDRVPAVAASRQQESEVRTRLHHSAPRPPSVPGHRAPEGDSNIRVGNDGSAFDSHSPRESVTDDYTHTHTRESATGTIPPFQRAEGGPRSDVRLGAAGGVGYGWADRRGGGGGSAGSVRVQLDIVCSDTQSSGSSLATDISAQIAHALQVSRSRVSVRICEQYRGRLSLEVCFWSLSAGAIGPTASGLASMMMQQAFTRTSPLRSQPLLRELVGANILLGGATPDLGSVQHMPDPRIPAQGGRVIPGGHDVVHSAHEPGTPPSRIAPIFSPPMPSPRTLLQVRFILV